ncbi:MAG: Fe-S cluster assembly ATPase SufC [Clostridia bacterium]|nr:Fe-S cluster assembly ATPase SufC [Clostridia bacterium]
MNTVFEIKNLQVLVYDKQILKGVNLKINGGEIHVIMGPNGAGKSTLASAIMGNPKYEVNGGEVLLNEQNLLSLEVDERARAGVFLAMQYPAEVSGVTNSNFIRSAVNATREKKLTISEFFRELSQAVNILEMRKDLPYRYLNDGFSGGEKKRNEILQMLMIKPKIAILDEIDSGLDIDALKIVGEALNKAQNENLGILIITHYQRILEYIKPHFVHIMSEGKIIKSGGIELIETIEREGYKFVEEAAKAKQSNGKA